MPPKRAAAIKATEANKPAASKLKATGRTSKKRAHSEDVPDDVGDTSDPDDEPPRKKSKAKVKPRGKAKSGTKSKATIDDDAEELASDENVSKLKDVAAEKNDVKTSDTQTPNAKVVPPVASNMVSVVKRGAAPVDPSSSFVATHQVLVADGEVWDGMLNQTNVANNNNKFYVIQLLHKIGDPSLVSLHTRWGRVGERGQSQDKGPWVMKAAINEFKKQFKAKTGAAWEGRHTMVAKSGKYMWLERDFNNDDDDEKKASGSGKAEAEEVKLPDVKAAPEVQSLIQFIFNSSFINAHLEEMNYDANKLPLGKLAKTTILNGFTALKTLAEVLNDPSGQKALSLGGAGRAYEELSNQYYSVIPHSFGRNRPIIINTQERLKKELEMLDALGDMEIASKVLSSTTSTTEDGVPIHPIDSHLASLDLNLIEPLDSSSREFAALEKYAQETHGATHSHYKVAVESIFRIERGGEEKRWHDAGHGNVPDGDRLLLWHGSRSTNFAGILKQGLRIAPPEAPVTGYMFGKGAYFADHMSKSANYCYANLSQDTGLLLLAEVVARPFNELLNAKYDADVDCKAKNAMATKGVGRVQPVAWQDCAEALGNQALKGVAMPKGPGQDVSPPGAYLQYNEYIVYDTSQIRLRYLLKVKMN